MIRHARVTAAAFALGAALLVLSSGAGTAIAAKGGRGSSGDSTTTTATINASCYVCPKRTVVHFWGSGYDGSQGKAILNIGGAITSTAVYPDGTLAFDWPYFTAAGTNVVNVYQSGKGGKLVLKATATIVVY